MSVLKALRQAAGLTAAGLADIAGSREMRIYAFERRRHRPHPDEARRIAQALDSKVEVLFPDMTGQIEAETK